MGSALWPDGYMPTWKPALADGLSVH
jgi:hypothetical protein